MPMMSPHNRRASRTSRAAGAALGAVGLIVLAAAPAAQADDNPPELVVGGIRPIDGAKPGSVLDLPATVTNKGTEAVGRVWVSSSVTRGLSFEEVPSNCRVQHVRPYDEMPERWTAVCAFDQVLEPGVVYTPETPLRARVSDRALYDEVRLRVGGNDPGMDDNGSAPVPGTAPAVELVEGQGGGEGSAPVVDVPVTSVNTADYRVTGAALKGSVGDTVTMKATFANAGPAWVMPRAGDKAVSVRITLPAGTSVVQRGQFCNGKGTAYTCGMRSLYEGGQETYTFQLKIDRRVAGAKGSVALSTEARPFDPDKANDRADITLDVTGAGPTAPSDGPTSGSGGPGDSTGGSAGSAGGSSTGGGATPHGGALAETGSSVLPTTAAAAAAVAAGGGTLLIVRRRRSRSLI